VFWWSIALLVLLGFTMMIEMGASNTLIQSMVPDGLRGRVMSVYTMMVMGMAPMGSLLSGAVANRLGAPNTVAIGGLICMVAAMIFAVRVRRIRVHARKLILAQREEG
jgi:MFS family permease